MSKFSQITTSYLLASCCVINILEATWSEPQSISSPNADVSIAMDGLGNVMVVWNDSMGSTANNIHYNHMKKNENWQTDFPFPSTEGRAILTAPKIAISADSKVVVTWEEWDYLGDNTTTLKMAMRPALGKWSFTDLSKTKGAGRFPSIAINATGYAVAGWREWEQTLESRKIIRASTLQFGNEWSTPTDIGFGEDVQVQVDKAGNSVAIWKDGETIMSATLPFGGNWTSPTTVGKAIIGSPAFAMNDSGYALVAWAEDGAIIGRTMHVGDDWSAPIKLPLPVQAFYITGLTAIMSAKGNALIAWKQDIVDQSLAFPARIATFIRSCELPYGKTWNNLERHTPKNEFASNVQIAVDDLENVYMIWTKQGTLHAKMRKPRLSWSNTETLSVEGINTDSRIVVDSTGYAVVCWGNQWGTIQSAIWRP